MANPHLTEFENRSTSDLLEQALELSRNKLEREKRNLVVAALEMRGDDETFEAAKFWSESKAVVERKLAADLLNQFGERAHNNDGTLYFPSAEKVVPLLTNLIDDPEPAVIASAVHGLGWNNAYDIILSRPELANHTAQEVRFAVACGLNGSVSKAAIDILIALSCDEDADVRDRANWGLALCNIDTPHIREALVRNLNDEQTDTRCEAMVGLARRKDVRVIPYIQKEIAAENVFYVAIEAAGHMASPDLIESLEDLRSRSDENRELLDRALNRCRGVLDPDDDESWVGAGEIVVPPWATIETKQ